MFRCVQQDGDVSRGMTRLYLSALTGLALFALVLVCPPSPWIGAVLSLGFLAALVLWTIGARQMEDYARGSSSEHGKAFLGKVARRSAVRLLLPVWAAMTMLCCVEELITGTRISYLRCFILSYWLCTVVAFTGLAHAVMVGARSLAPQRPARAIRKWFLGSVVLGASIVLTTASLELSRLLPKMEFGPVVTVLVLVDVAAKTMYCVWWGLGMVLLRRLHTSQQSGDWMASQDGDHTSCQDGSEEGVKDDQRGHH